MPTGPIVSLFGTVKLDTSQALRSMSRLEKSGPRVGKAIKMGFLAATAAVVGTTAALTAIGAASVKAAISFESAMAGVRKTTDLTTEEFARLQQGIRDMATDATNPVAGLPAAHNSLAGIAEQAGQLGVTGVNNILKFTEVIGKLSLSTNLGEDAAAQLAQFANITGLAFEDMDRLGSSIVALGNSMATTERDIVEFAQRLAGAATTAGLSEQEILALSGAMASVGLNPEAGGTAMTQTLNRMAEAFGRGGEELRAFAQVANVSAADFASAFENEPIRAIQMLVEGLSGLSASEQVQALDSLGLSGIRTADTLRRLAGNTELLNSALATSNEAWQENTALQTEAEQRLNTTAAQWNVLKNTLNDIAIRIGERLLPGINAVVSGLQTFLASEGFTSWLDNTLDLAGRLAVALGDVASSVINTLKPAFQDIENFLFGEEPNFDQTAAFGPEWTGNTFAPGSFRLRGEGGFTGSADNPQTFFNQDPRRGFVDELIDKFTFFKDHLLPGIVDRLKQDWVPILEDVRDLFVDDILPAVVDFWESIDQDVVPVLETAYEVVLGMVRTHVDLAKAGIGAWNLIKTKAQIALEYIQPILDALPSMWEDFRLGAEEAFNWIKSNVPNISTPFGDIGGGSSSSSNRTGTGTNVFGRAQSAIQSATSGLLNSALATSNEAWQENTAGLARYTGPPILPSGGGGRATFRFSSRDSGGSVRRGQPYMIGRGAQPELFIPDSNGTMVPNADRAMGGVTVHGGIHIHANTREGGAAAMQGAMDVIGRARGRGLQVTGI